MASWPFGIDSLNIDEKAGEAECECSRKPSHVRASAEAAQRQSEMFSGSSVVISEDEQVTGIQVRSCCLSG